MRSAAVHRSPDPKYSIGVRYPSAAKIQSVPQSHLWASDPRPNIGTRIRQTRSDLQDMLFVIATSHPIDARAKVSDASFSSVPRWHGAATSRRRHSRVQRSGSPFKSNDVPLGLSRPNPALSGLYENSPAHETGLGCGNGIYRQRQLKAVADSECATRIHYHLLGLPDIISDDFAFQLLAEHQSPVSEAWCCWHRMSMYIHYKLVIAHESICV